MLKTKGKPYNGVVRSTITSKWASPNITVSFMPNRTKTPYGQSNLFQLLKPLGKENWQAEIQRALHCWQSNSAITFKLVEDDGSPQGSFGLAQSDPRFGDIRIGAADIGQSLAATVYPENNNDVGGTHHGDLFLNSRYTWRIGKRYDLFSVVLHELGHALGLNHSKEGTVMYGTYTGVKAGLAVDDISAIKSIYG